MKTRITRSRVVSTMWAGGRPCHDYRYANVFFVARKAGLNSSQAMAVACATFDAANRHVESLSTCTNALRHATLEALATDPKSPHSLWAYLSAKLGHAYRYVTDVEIRNTSMNDHAGWSAWAQKVAP